jgi:large repetitive protein
MFVSTLLALTMGSTAWADTLSTTSYAGAANGSGGVMFSVQATNSLTITGLSVYSYSASSALPYLVYYTTSALASVTNTPSAWTQVAAGTTGAVSQTVGHDITLTTPISMPAGSTYAIYATFTSGTMFYRNGTALGADLARDSNFAILQGHGRSYTTAWTSSLNTPRTYVGTITYTACTASTWYRDADGDSFGTSSTSQSACTQPSGYVSNSTDCNDNDATINPRGTEICDAANADEDCDGSADDSDSSATGQTSWYVDADADTYGSSSSILRLCDQPTGYSSSSTDCNDSNAAINPGATELCDASNTDEDCDGQADDSDRSATGQSTWYADTDADSYGNPSSSLARCDQPSGYLADNTDCDDSRVDVNPGATERCDAANTDEDCDGSTDDNDSSATQQSYWYLDADSDSYGNPASSMYLCEQPRSYVADSTDCDDSLGSINPAAQEICDTTNTDEDCDGSSDDSDSSATGKEIWYQDADGDRYGNSNNQLVRCDQPTGYVDDLSDCDDSQSGVNPGATEICDSQNTDEDCDGNADDNDASVASAGFSSYYEDADSDGYGTSNVAIQCDAPAGYVFADNTDCDDSDANISPGATEVCNGYDDNCDGLADEAAAADAGTWYADLDGDGYGDPASITRACTAPTGFLADGTDCDDGLAVTNPGTAETCDGLDNNCDNVVDENSAVDAPTWYNDGDGDGYGGAGSQVACNQPTGTSAYSSDCNDTDISIYPGATEVPYDNIDQDCSGSDTCDADGDGANALVCNGDDCNDEDADIYVGAPEAWYDGVDQDCSGGSDYDYDGDGYDSQSYGGDDCDDNLNDVYPGAPDQPYDGVINDCDAANEYDADSDGYQSADWGGNDCDDANSAIRPGVAEVWYDGLDQNCDGASDYDADADGFDSADWGGDDCDDAAADINPDAADEPYDGQIADCDPSDEYDVDGDGALHSSGGGNDCNDDDAAVNPSATEAVADGVDSDCDGGDLCYVDADNDGQRDADGGTLASTDLDCADAGEAEEADPDTDCDDATATTFAGAEELCDGVDNSCDGTVDEGCAGDSQPVDDSGKDSGKGEEPPCGCSSGAPEGALGLLLLGGLVLRRRSRREN